jgi:hypothetical protein
LKVCKCGECRQWVVDWDWEYVRCYACYEKYLPHEFNALPSKSLAEYEREKAERLKKAS